MPDGGHDVCAVIVTYRPDGNIGTRIERVASEVAHVVVVDNGSEPGTVRSLQSAASRLGVELVLNESNRGVATALNQGVERARERGFAWALLLDHDTVVRAGISATLHSARAAHPRPERVAIVGSNYVETAHGRPFIDRVPGAGAWVDTLIAITAGSLLSIAAFEDVGRFRDELFIDDVDTDFCLRLRARGYLVILATQVTMDQTIGAAHREHRFLWRTVRPLNYSPLRWYYLMRNSVIVAREHRQVAPHWAGPHVRAHLKWALKAVLFEQSRMAKLRAILRGSWDGLRGRLGPRVS
jgi:rhamnosyltransferase